MKRKSNLLPASIAAMALLCACSGNNSGGDNASSCGTEVSEIAAINLEGQWDIEEITLNDSVSVHPSEIVPGVCQYIKFEDGTYFVQTNCNTISGRYTLEGDSLNIGDGAMTEMACDNMDTEDAFRQILPYIETVTADNDTVVQLNTSAPSAYIILRRQK